MSTFKPLDRETLRALAASFLETLTLRLDHEATLADLDMLETLRVARVEAGRLVAEAAQALGKHSLCFTTTYATTPGHDDEEGECGDDLNNITNPHSNLNDGWLEEVAAAVAKVCPINLSHADPVPTAEQVEAGVEVIVRCIELAQPMEHIVLCSTGEKLVNQDWLPTPAGMPRRRYNLDDPIAAAPYDPGFQTGVVGKHVGCGGPLALRPSSTPAHDRITCGGCGFTTRVGHGFTSYRELQTWSNQLSE